jgi:hypothetical protein
MGMSMQGMFAGLCGLALMTACRHQPAPEPGTALASDSSCARPDSGVDLGQDVSRKPRYRVDSSGRVETLPPVPARSDTLRRGCPAASDTSTRDSSGTAKP